MLSTKEGKPLDPALHSLVSLLEQKGYAYALIGGAAIALTAYARATKDIDAIVLDENPNYQEFSTSAAEFGFEPATADAVEFAMSTRILCLRHAPSQVRVDLVFGILPYETRAVARALPQQFGGHTVQICSPEDLIILKSIVGRGEDLVDIEMILEIKEDLDYKYLEKWIKWMARELEEPQIWERIRELKFWRPN